MPEKIALGQIFDDSGKAVPALSGTWISRAKLCDRFELLMAPIRRRIMAGVDRIRFLRQTMPFRDALVATLAQSSRREVSIFVKAISRDVIIRSGTSDLECLEQVFIYNEYELPFELTPQLIVDAGANVGMATLFFSARYPNARIVAIEPEPENFRVLTRNCEGLANVTLIQAALWPTNDALEIIDPKAEAWSFAVSERTSNWSRAPVLGITMADIIKREQIQKIDLLKIDVEGSELQIFTNGAEKWIDLVDTIAIELHDRYRPGCAQAFYSLLATRKFTQETKGQNIFVRLLR